MALNIKNPRVHDLAKEAARLTGLSQTGAIEEALVRLVRDLGADPAAIASRARLDVVHDIAVAYATDPGQPDRQISTIEDLYDDRGLPR